MEMPEQTLLNCLRLHAAKLKSTTEVIFQITRIISTHELQYILRRRSRLSHPTNKPPMGTPSHQEQ